MSRQGDRVPFAWLIRRRSMRPEARIRRRWGTYARQAAVADVLGELALTAEEGASLFETLRLLARAPLRTFMSLPVVQISILLVLSVFTMALLVLPTLIWIMAILPFAGSILVVIAACRSNRHIHRESLVVIELSQILAEGMAQGQPLSQVMSDLPRIFSPAQAATVRAGERAGNLAPALRSLATEARIRQSKGVINFYRHYPVFALFFIMLISLFVMWRIFPKLVDIYAQLDVEMPRFTLALASVFDWLLGGGLTLGVILLTTVICFYLDHLIRLHLGRIASGVACTLVILALLGARVSETFREPVWVGPNAIAIGFVLIGILILVGALMPAILDVIRARASIISSWVARTLPWWRRRRCHLERANFLAALGLMLERQVPAPEALRLAAPAIAPAGLAHSVEHAARAVESGEDLGAALVRRHLLKPREEAMLRLAARAGDLPAECMRLSEQLADEARLIIARTDRVLRPLSVLLVAALAAPVLIGVYLPLFRIAMLAVR